jgi:tetratricopeptide (TPR) repeat protein
LAFLGDFREGQEQCEKALRLASEINDIGIMGIAEFSYGALFWVKGDGEKVIEHANNAVKYVEQAQLVTVLGQAWGNLGYGYALLGDMETALKYMEKGFEIDRDLGISWGLPWHYWNLSWVDIELGDLAKARSFSEKALELAQKEEDKMLEGLSLLVLGRALGRADKSQFAQAEDCFVRGTKLLDECKARPSSAWGRLFLGELCADAGQREKALETLKKAESAYREMGMDYWLRKTQEVMTKLQV